MKTVFVLGALLIALSPSKAQVPFDSLEHRSASQVAHRIDEKRVDTQDILAYLHLTAWKYELRVEEPFKGHVMRVVHYRRTAEGTFSTNILADAATILSEPTTNLPVTLIFDGEVFTLQGHFRSGKIGDQLKGYVTFTGGDGRTISKEQVLMAKGRNGKDGGTIRAKDEMEAYVALEVELLYDGGKQNERGQPGGAANRSRPNGSETNRTSAMPGSAG